MQYREPPPQSPTRVTVPRLDLQPTGKVPHLVATAGKAAGQ
jgi:hypothetical protein